MTDILTRDPNDTGDIPLGIGEQRTVILRRDTGEATQRIDPRLINAPSYEAIPRRTIDIDDTVTYMPATIGIADQAAAQPIAPWERVAGVEDTAVHSILDSLAGVSAGLDGKFDGPQKPPPPIPPVPKLRRSVPVAAMVDRQQPGAWGRFRYRGARRRARLVSPWVTVAAVVGFGVAVYAGVLLAVLAVVR